MTAAMAQLFSCHKFLLLGVVGEHRPFFPRPLPSCPTWKGPRGTREVQQASPMPRPSISTSLLHPFGTRPLALVPFFTCHPDLPLLVLSPEPQVERMKYRSLSSPLLSCPVLSPPFQESWHGLTECIKLIAILVIRYNHSLPAGCFSSRRVWNYFLEFAI